ncbi:MAG: TatD family hydrolase, partial [Patescibacteria group bacterium]
MIFDAHTHVHFPAYEQDRNQVIKRAQEAGVKMICVGTQFSTSESAIKLAEQYPNDVWATAGFHPSHFNDDWYHDWKEQKSAAREKFDIKKLKKLAEHPKIVAIGECGMDYFRIMKHETRIMKQQHEVFSEQIRLAQELKKPLMVHCRPSRGTDDAYHDLLSLIHDSGFMLHVIVHFYVGSQA